jgi:hypothetical protein
VAGLHRRYTRDFALKYLHVKQPCPTCLLAHHLFLNNPNRSAFSVNPGETKNDEARIISLNSETVQMLKMRLREQEFVLAIRWDSSERVGETLEYVQSSVNLGRKRSSRLYWCEVSRSAKKRGS